VGLRSRLTLLFALATALLVGVAAFGFVLQLRVSLDATLDTALDTRAAALAERLADTGPANLRLDHDEEPAQVLSPSGQVLASSSDLAAASPLTPAQLQAVLAGHGPVRLTADLAGERTRLLAVLTPDTHLVLIAGLGTDISDAAAAHVENGLLIGGPAAVLVAGLGAWLLAGAALRPVERMRRQTATISAHDADAHLAVPATQDEIAALAVTMNDLLDRLRAALDRERGFVADAGHELRTPLAMLRAELELAGRPGRSRAELVEAVAAAGQETERLIRLSESLLLLARAEGGHSFLHARPTSVHKLLSSAARAANAGAAERCVTVEVACPERLTGTTDPDRLRQAVDNLLDNAVRHSPPGRVVRLSACRLGSPPILEITVRDHGPGFPPEFIPHAFERFSRADTSRARAEGGAGLGLAIVRAIVRAHGGGVSVRNHPAGGAVVELRLPRHDLQRAGSAPVG
jgi:hypothetical protein